MMLDTVEDVKLVCMIAESMKTDRRALECRLSVGTFDVFPMIYPLSKFIASGEKKATTRTQSKEKHTTASMSTVGSGRSRP